MKKLRENNKQSIVICLSGYMDYVFEALKVKIFDYLLKPISYDKLKSCILRLISYTEKSNSVFINFNNSKLKVKQNDINYIEKNRMKAIIHTKSSIFETYTSLEKLKSCLPDNFKRCHKSYIVNTHNVSNINYTKNQIYFNNNSCCPIGLKYKSDIAEVIKNAKYN